MLQVWFKNRRAKWRKQKREEQERIRKIQDERNTHNVLIKSEFSSNLSPTNNDLLSQKTTSFSDEAEDSSDLEVA